MTLRGLRLGGRLLTPLGAMCDLSRVLLLNGGVTLTCEVLVEGTVSHMGLVEPRSDPHAPTIGCAVVVEETVFEGGLLVDNEYHTAAVTLGRVRVKCRIGQRNIVCRLAMDPSPIALLGFIAGKDHSTCHYYYRLTGDVHGACNGARGAAIR